MIIMGILVSLLIFGPLSKYLRKKESPFVLKNAVNYEIWERDSEDRIILGMKHPVDKYEKRHKNDGKWTRFNSTFPIEAYMYTAFYDDRKSLASLPVVRIIAVMEEYRDFVMFCVLSYKGSNKMEYILASKRDVGAGVPRQSKVLVEYIISCTMPHEEIPSRVGVVAMQRSELPVMIPIEIPVRPGMAYDFGVCISVAYWKQDPYHIIEWFELLRLMGVSGISVYNNSLADGSARVFLEYVKEGFVDFRQSHNFVNEDGELPIHMHMSPVINDCMYRNMYKYKKIIVTDFDELIVPRKVFTYQEMIKEIDEKQLPNNHSPGRNYLFRNNYFFTDIPGEDQTQSEHLTSLRHRMRLEVSEPGYAIKSIINPLSCTHMHNHYCWQRSEIYGDSELLIEVDPEYAVNQHYKRCHFDTWDRKEGACNEAFKKAIHDDTMLRYVPQLQNQMNVMLKRLGLKTL